MISQSQIKALAELDGWILEPAGKDSFGVFYAAFWRHQEKPGQHILPPYLTSYDAIIPLMVRICEVDEAACSNLNRYFVERGCFSVYHYLTITPTQLCEALLRATGMWI